MDEMLTFVACTLFLLSCGPVDRKDAIIERLETMGSAECREMDMPMLTGDSLFVYSCEENSKLFEVTLHPNKAIRCIREIDSSGRKNGICKCYFPGGSLSTEGTYYLGKRTDSWTFYWENGMRKTTATYFDDKIIGNYSKYNYMGNLYEFYLLDLNLKSGYTLEIDSLTKKAESSGRPFYTVVSKQETYGIEDTFRANIFVARNDSFNIFLRLMPENPALHTSYLRLQEEIENSGIYLITLVFKTEGWFQIPAALDYRDNHDHLIQTQAIYLHFEATSSGTGSFLIEMAPKAKS